MTDPVRPSNAPNKYSYVNRSSKDWFEEDPQWPSGPIAPSQASASSLTSQVAIKNAVKTWVRTSVCGISKRFDTDIVLARRYLAHRLSHNLRVFCSRCHLRPPGKIITMQSLSLSSMMDSSLFGISELTHLLELCMPSQTGLQRQYTPLSQSVCLETEPPSVIRRS